MHETTSRVFRVLLTVILMSGALVACGEQPSGTALSDRAEAEAGPPDPIVTGKVKAKLTSDPEINPFRIDVDTQQGVVSLSGEVNSDAERDLAERIARGTDGVRDVINNLEIDADSEEHAEIPEDAEILEATGAARDALITTAVKARLLADSELEGLEIDVDTAGSVVSLSGTVASTALKKHAERVASDTAGVEDVINNLDVRAG